jgi:hypothetical protein
MDAGTLVVDVIVNSIVDIDTDLTNQGLAFPQPRSNRSLFSGLYKILTITNSFSGGVFTQTLSMVRLMNSDWVTNSAATEATTSSANRTTPGAATKSQSNLTLTPSSLAQPTNQLRIVTNLKY